MILDVDKTEFTRSELEELKRISELGSIDLMTASGNIYRGICEIMEHEHENEKIWVFDTAVSTIFTYGYMLGVRAERKKRNRTSKKV